MDRLVSIELDEVYVACLRDKLTGVCSACSFHPVVMSISYRAVP